MSEWKRLTPEDHEQSVYVRYQHIIPAHWNREHHIQMMPLRNDVRLMNTEALAFAALVPEVKALVTAVGDIRDALASNAAPWDVKAAIEELGQATLGSPLLLNLLNAYEFFQEAA